MPEAKRLDVFTGVHKGLRNALFKLAVQAGATDAARSEEVGSLAAEAREVFHFLEHHAANEDRYLVPDMQAESMPEAARMLDGHGELDAELKTLQGASSRLGGSPALLHGFYLALNRFISNYLHHLDEEERAFLPALHARFSDEDLAGFSRKSVASTAPKDQEMMLSHMFPAMNGAELKEFFDGIRGKAPAEAVAYLEAIAGRVLGGRAKAI
jgi:hypothetical protein